MKVTVIETGSDAEKWLNKIKYTQDANKELK